MPQNARDRVGPLKTFLGVPRAPPSSFFGPQNTLSDSVGSLAPKHLKGSVFGTDRQAVFAWDPKTPYLTQTASFCWWAAKMLFLAPPKSTLFCPVGPSCCPKRFRTPKAILGTRTAIWLLGQIKTPCPTQIGSFCWLATSPKPTNYEGIT